MHRRHRLPTLLLLSLLVLSTALFGQQLPDVTSAIEHAINPIVLIDGDSGELLLANPSARRFFADDGPVSLDTLFSLTSGPVTDLHGTVVTLGDPPTHQMVSVIHVGGAPHSYFVIMLQNWDAQHRLAVRNRLLLALLFILLTACLIVFFILLRTQATLLKRFHEHQRRQESTVVLFQQFLDNDPRLSYVRDSKGAVIFANKTFEKHFGTPPYDESVVTSLLGPVVIGESMDEIQRIVKTGETINAVRHYKGRTVRVFKFPVRVPDGGPGVGVLIGDITDEMQVEEILRENLRRSALLVEMLSSVHTDDQAYADRGLELACTLTDSSAALLLLYNEREGVLSIASSCRLHTPPTELSRATTAYLLDRTAGGRALIENGDTEANPLASVMGSKLESLLTVPFYADEVLGGIVLLSDSKGGYDEQDGYQVQLLFSSLYTAALKSQRDRELQESRASLRLILDSTAEGIFGIDERGHCTFANLSSLSLLGYTDQDELLGKSIHETIHPKRRDGSPLKIQECPICNTIDNGVGIIIENEVFWRKDGSCFDVLASAYPQKWNDRTIGAVITFSDNTERKQAQDRIEYLSFHDQLTGLYNRTYFDQALTDAQNKAVLPFSIIVSDVNGLKLTNDIFGHSAGDELLIEIAHTLTRHCPPKAIISRIGGDEFVILLPRHDEKQTELIATSILESLDRPTIFTGRQALALGSATRHSIEEPIHEVFDHAEDLMYQQKMLRLRETQHHQLEVLIHTLFEKAPQEERHAERVKNHAIAIGAALGLDDENLSILGRAGYYHDIGKLVLDADLIASKGNDPSQRRAYQSHVSAGYRILNTFEETMDLAPYVLHHHEWYNGGGYLKGLGGKEIPYLSRIIRLAEIWEREDLDEKSIEEIVTTLNGVSGVEADPQMIHRIIASL